MTLSVDYPRLGTTSISPSRDREDRQRAAPSRFAEFIRKPRIKRSRDVRPTLENSQAACNFAPVYVQGGPEFGTSERGVILRQKIGKKLLVQQFFLSGSSVFEEIDFKVCSSLSFYAMNCLRC